MISHSTSICNQYFKFKYLIVNLWTIRIQYADCGGYTYEFQLSILKQRGKLIILSNSGTRMSLINAQ